MGDIWENIIQASSSVEDFFRKLEAPTEIPLEVPSVAARRDRQFFPPLPGRLFRLLAPLPGKALALYMILRLRSRLECRQTVVLTSTFVTQFGITRSQKALALACLETHKLIMVDHRHGKNPRVTLRVEDVPWIH
jgi:hypothetical protein